MKTQVNAQNTPVFGSWWESTDLQQKGHVGKIHDRIDKYMDEFGSMGAIENLSTMLEHYLFVETQVCQQTDPKEISSMAVNTTSLIAFISTLNTEWKYLRSIDTPKTKSTEPTSSLDQAISEVWAGYLDVKQRFNAEDEDIESKLVAWRELISEWAGVTVAVIPDDYEWQKPLEDFRKEYQALIRL